MIYDNVIKRKLPKCPLSFNFCGFQNTEIWIEPLAWGEPTCYKVQLLEKYL